MTVEPTDEELRVEIGRSLARAFAARGDLPADMAALVGRLASEPDLLPAPAPTRKRPWRK